MQGKVNENLILVKVNSTDIWFQHVVHIYSIMNVVKQRFS